jgi:lipoprotein signal peptidase
LPPVDKARAEDSRRPVTLSGPAALKCPAAIILFLGVTAAGLAGDLASKHVVFQWLLDRPNLPEEVAAARLRLGDVSTTRILQDLHLRRRIMPGVSVTLQTNPGLAFGKGKGIPRWLVAGATLVTMAMVLYFFATSRPKARSVHVSLAFILSGALGNLYDRLFGQVLLPGVEPIRYQVRDFIDCTELYWLWVFNVADVLLVVGVGLLMIHWWRGERPGKPASA